jgi:uncharacterized protein YrrD
MPVLCASHVLGRVADICFSCVGEYIGLLIEEQNMRIIPKKGFLPFEQIVKMDTNKVFSRSHFLRSAHLSKKWIQYNQLKHKMIVNEKKEQVGILEDVYISIQAGTMVAYEISDGLFADLMDGRKYMPSKKTAIILQNDTILLAEQ